MTAIAADMLPTLQIAMAPISEAERENAMQALAPILDRYGADVDRVPRSDLARSSAVLLRAHAHATSPGQLERWRSLPSAELDLGCLDALRPLAVGCRDVRAAVSSWDAQVSEARIPLTLASDAAAHKRRVMRYVGYQLGDDPATAREIADIRSGIGYLDLESDLRRLAVLVKAQGSLLAQDRFYDAGDAQACVRFADAIASELAKDAAAPSDWLARVHAAIYRCYHLEVLPTAAWLYRKTPAAIAFYPSVYGASSRGRSSRAAPSVDGESEVAALAPAPATRAQPN